MLTIVFSERETDSEQAERLDLYFDGEYCGSYELSEKNQLNSNRIDITDMEEVYEAYNEDYGKNPKTTSAKNSYGNRYYYTRGLTDPWMRILQ